MTGPPLQIERVKTPETQEEIPLQTLNVAPAGNKVSPLSRRQAELAEGAIALTKDEKSRKRYQQLAGIVVEAGREDLWDAGVYAPVGSPAERADVQAQIAASFKQAGRGPDRSRPPKMDGGG